MKKGLFPVIILAVLACLFAALMPTLGLDYTWDEILGGIDPTQVDYSLYSENEISDNFYSTYTREDEMLYYYYCSNSGETRVIIAEDVLLPSLDAVMSKNTSSSAPFLS